MSTLSKVNLEGLPAGSRVEDGDGDNWVKTDDGRWALADSSLSYAVTTMIALFTPLTLVEAN
jgi:hypothetical protein